MMKANPNGPAIKPVFSQARRFECSVKQTDDRKIVARDADGIPYVFKSRKEAVISIKQAGFVPKETLDKHINMTLIRACKGIRNKYGTSHRAYGFDWEYMD